MVSASRRNRHASRVCYPTKTRLWNTPSVTALILVFVTVVSNWLQRRQREISEAQTRREATLREETQKSLARAEAAERASQQQLYAALLEQARATVLTGEHGQRFRALEAARRAGAISNSAALRGVAVAALALPDLHFERELPIMPGVTGAQLDPAFERIALCRSSGPVEIRSAADQQLLASLPASTNRPTFGGLWSSDGRFFAVNRDHDPAGRVKDVEVWEVAAARRVLLVRDTPWGAISFHPLLARIMVGRAPDAAATWDLETGQELVRHGLEGQPIVLKFSRDGESFAASYESGQGLVIAVHHASDGTRRSSHLFTNRVTALDWDPSGHWISVPDRGGTVHLMETQTGKTQVLGRHKSDAVATEFSPDGRYLFSGGWDNEVICWDVKAMRRAFTVGLDSNGLQFRADGGQCAITRGYAEVRVQLHTFERPALHREFAEDLGGHRNSAAFSPDGRWLAASGGERWVVWELHSAGPGAAVKGVIETRVSFAANGELFVNPRGACFRWRVRPGTNAAAPPELERLDLPQPPGLLSLCLVSNGVVFTGTRGSRLAAYDQLQQFNEPIWARTVAGLNGASPDERWLGMFVPYGPHLYIHRLPGLEPVAKLTNGVRISQFEFSPLGDEVAVSSRGGVDFWSTTNWEQTRHLTNFTGLLYSSDARTFWLWTAYRTAGLYDARTAQPLLPLPPNTLPLALSPDSRHLAVSVDLRRVQVWDLVEVQQRLRELGLDWESTP